MLCIFCFLIPHSKKSKLNLFIDLKIQMKMSPVTTLQVQVPVYILYYVCVHYVRSCVNY